MERFDPDSLPNAARQCDLTAATELLRSGADPNGKDPLGYTPLMPAAGLGNIQMVELLLTAGGNVPSWTTAWAPRPSAAPPRAGWSTSRAC